MSRFAHIVQCTDTHVAGVLLQNSRTRLYEVCCLHLPEVRAGDEAVACNECRRVDLPSTHPTGHMDCPLLQDRVACLKARTDYG